MTLRIIGGNPPVQVSLVRGDCAPLFVNNRLINAKCTRYEDEDEGRRTQDEGPPLNSRLIWHLSFIYSHCAAAFEGVVSTGRFDVLQRILRAG